MGTQSLCVHVFIVCIFVFCCCPPPTQINPVCVLLAELRTSLEEHQSALELIMTKYREQVFRLLMASKRDDPAIVSQLKEQHTTVSDAFIFVVCLLVLIFLVLTYFTSNLYTLIFLFHFFFLYRKCKRISTRSTRWQLWWEKQSRWMRGEYVKMRRRLNS